MTNLESIRKSYKPDKIKVHFIGESPPAGGTFFYNADSTLWRYTQEAFSKAFDVNFADGKSFLEFFKWCGCYLDDLSLEPVNNLKTARERNAKCRAYIGSMAGRIKEANPVAIIVVKKSIVKFVLQALELSGVMIDKDKFFPLLHPAHGHHKRYVDELSEVLRKLRKNGVLTG